MNFYGLVSALGNTLVGALYHPPRPLYTADSLLDYIEACLDELFCVCRPRRRLQPTG